jgi:hypothetical protein
MAITWSIVQLDYALSEDGYTDVVNNSHWQCIDEDASGNQARVYGSVGIPTDDLSNFTPYADITEAQALQWTKDALGAEEVASIEANVADQLQLLENPTEGSGTPWAA